MPIFNKQDDRILGIDLGSDSIKVVELKIENQQPRLATYGVATREKKDLLDSRENTVIDLRNTLTQARTTTSKAVGALPAASVFSTIIDFPQMPRKEINSAIRWEAKKILPLPIEKMSLNWHILPETYSASDNENKTVKIILSAAPKETINEYLETFNEAGLRLISLETEIKALQRSLLVPDNDTCLVIDIGATNTNMIVFKKNLPLINRNFDIGGETFRLTVANTLNVSLERAEQLKNNFSLPSNEQTAHPVVKALKFTIDNMIVQEIRHLNKALQSATQVSINKIILTGGGAHLKNLSGYLQYVLQIETVVGDPWQKIIYPKELTKDIASIGPEMSVAIGLALKGVIK